MSNFQIHELTEKAINRNSNIIHDTLSGGSYETGKNLAGAVADLASANVAAPYNSATTYAIGQYCLYEGNIYRCIAITTGTFDATKWTQIVVTSEFRRVVELTTAQYEALSSAEQNNGTLYIITDGIPPSETVTGSDIIPFIDVSDSNKPKSTTAAALGDAYNTVKSGTLEHATDYASALDDDWDSSIQQMGKLLFISLSIRLKATTYSNDYYNVFKIPSSFKMPSKQYDIRALGLSSTLATKSIPIRFSTNGTISIARTYTDQSVIADVFILIGT